MVVALLTTLLVPTIAVTSAGPAAAAGGCPTTFSTVPWTSVRVTAGGYLADPTKATDASTGLSSDGTDDMYGSAALPMAQFYSPGSADLTCSMFFRVRLAGNPSVTGGLARNLIVSFAIGDNTARKA